MQMLVLIVLHCIVLYLYCAEMEVIFFDSVGVEHVPEEIKKAIGHKNIKANLFRVQQSI